jgi:hypothetical protein
MCRAFPIAVILVATSLMLPAAARADDPLFPTRLDGVACFENLVTPEYPAEALSKKIGGFVWATIKANQDGKVDSIETNVIANAEAKNYLVAPVEKAIRAAQVKADCKGQTISIDFRYELPGDTFAEVPGESGYLVRIRSTAPDADKSASDKSKE